MNDLFFLLLLIAGFCGAVVATGWTAHLIFSWIGNRLPWRTPPAWAAGSSLPPAPPWAINPYVASYRRALREWGTTIVDTGEAAGMGWSQLLFKIDPAVAGVSELLTVLGEAVFTPGLRCMIVIDRARIAVLDRERQRGILLEADWPREGVRARLEGTSLWIHFFTLTTADGDPAGGQDYSERLFSIDLHSKAGLEVVPAGWPGDMVELPERPRDAAI